MRFGRTLFAMALLLAVAACGSSGGTATPKSAPLEFHDGFAKVDVPLSPRYTEPAAGGKWVFVYGGWETSGGGRAFADGAIYDVDTQEWATVPAAPFADPLWGARSVWTGKEFVVLGQPCPDPQVSEESVDWVVCGDDPMEAAAFDPVTARWTTVDAPNPFDPDTTDAVIDPLPIGAYRGRAVFLIEPSDVARGTALVVIGPGAAPEVIPPLPAAQNRCALGDRLFAIGSGDTGRVPAPAGAIEPTNTWAYRDGTWVDDGGLGPTTVEAYGHIGGSVTCAATAIGYVGLAGAGKEGGRGGEVDWFDPAAGWRRLPDLPPVAGATEVALAQAGADPLVWTGDRITVLRDGAWSRRSAAGYGQLFPGAAPAELGAAGRFLVGKPLVDPVQHQVLVVVDPDALPPAA